MALVEAAAVEVARRRRAWAFASLDELVAAAEGWVAHPCAGHRVDAGEVWWDTGVRLRDGDRFGAAAEAFGRAIAAGYRSWPLPETDIAECWLRDGRTDDAARLFEEVRRREPRDGWLYLAAGFAYVAVGELEVASGWFTAGVELALTTGDPERLVTQLDEARTRTRAALGHPDVDDLAARVAAFEDEPEHPTPDWSPLPYQGTPPVVVTSCAYCGWTAEPASGGGGGPRRRTVEPRRNEPCWCGSGRKYKRCCGLPDTEPGGGR